MKGEIMKLIHISDLHFHRRKNDNKEAIAMLDFIKQNYPDHYLIVTGDIADDGHAKQFDQAFKALKPFKGRVFICPGNHDFGAMGNFYSRERAERFDRMLSDRLDQGGTFTGDATPVVNVIKEEEDEIMLIAVDTNLETEHPFDFACGEVGATQLSALQTILSDHASSGMIKILFFHHHPLVQNNPFMELKDGYDLWRTIFGKADMLLFGHKHVSDSWQNMNGVQYVLASDNSPGKKYAREIVFDNSVISVNDVEIF